MSKFPIALASAATIAALGLGMAPAASAADTALFLGGTGTGYVPAGPTAEGFTDPFVPAPYTSINYIYDGAPWVTPQASVPALNAAVAAQQSAGNEVTVVGLSKGAQVAQASMHAEGAPAPGSVIYVLLANPDRDGGFSTAMGWRPPQGEVRYDVVNVYGEYDGFADWPDRPNLLAMANAAAGIVYVHLTVGTGTRDDILTRMHEADIEVSDNLDAEGKPNGTTSTEIRVPTHELPLTRPMRDLERALTGQTGLTDGLDRALRPAIDRGYSRNDSPAVTTGGNARRDTRTTDNDREIEVNTPADAPTTDRSESIDVSDTTTTSNDNDRQESSNDE